MDGWKQKQKQFMMEGGKDGGREKRGDFVSSFRNFFVNLKNKFFLFSASKPGNFVPPHFYNPFLLLFYPLFTCQLPTLLYINYLRFFKMQNWSTQADQHLLTLFSQIQVYNRWKQISKRMIQAGFNKTQLQCRNRSPFLYSRYHNKLNPNLKSDEWSKKEIQNIFRFYDEYGSKWNFIQTVIPGRTQNNIKNRFFSTLKNLLRKLLKKFTEPENENSLKYISSRDVTDLYEGRGKYKRFKGLIKKILRRINFQIDFKAINPIIDEYEENLKELTSYFTYKEDQRLTEKSQGSSKCKAETQHENKNEEVLMENQANCQISNPTFGFYPQNFLYPQVNYFGYVPSPMVMPTQANYLFMPTFVQEGFDSQQALMINSNLKVNSPGIFSQTQSP